MNLSNSQIKEQKFRKLAQKVVAEMKRLSVPGAAVGVWHKGREHSAGFGVTSIENPLPVTADTLFQVGSISKTFTGTLLMQLAEQGKIGLDLPIRKYMKDFKLRDESVAKHVTTRHLLTHTGGWVGDYFNDFGNDDDALAKMVASISKLEQISPLGKLWSYNNAGFNIAARLVEVVTRKPYEQAAQEMLLDPLGLDMTYFFPSDILITHRFVVGHYKKNGKLLVARPWAIGRAGNGVGGVVSTVKDLLAYARFHMGNGRRIIKRKSLEAMRVPQAHAGGRGKMGITWFIRQTGDITIFSHGGATYGQQAGFYFIPEKDFALAVLTNSDDGGIITAGIINWALDIYFNMRLQTPRPIKIRANELKEFIGSYRIGTEAFDLRIKNNYLMYHHIPLGGFPTPESPPSPAMPIMRFAFYNKDEIIGLDEPMKGALGDFIRDEKGRVRFLRVGGRAHKKMT